MFFKVFMTFTGPDTPSAQWYKIVIEYIYNQQVAQVIQVGSKMDTVMMLQIIKGATLMEVIAVDQTPIHNGAQIVYAMQI